jgi:kumamolisin
MAPGMASLVMYIGSTDSAIFNAMATAKPLNAQLSSSWYWSPADPKTLNPIFEEFAAQGQNLFDAAGDNRSWQIGGSIWPADNAYLVSVGGTDLETKSAGGPWSSETAWSDSGGGTSPNDIPIPSWQVATADQCIDKCSTSLRNGPDVSANSNFTFYVCADQTTCTANEYGGTSFAAPMWAGYLALANQQLIANGSKTTLGFIDPALYTIGLSSNYDTDFHDITSGSNGYSATNGYDLVTGWGSPNGDNLINALVGGGGGGGPVVSLSPTSINFGKKVVGSTSGAKKVILTNTGNATLSITSIATSAPFALKTVKQTKKVTPCVNGGTVAAGATCEIEVTFSPTAVQSYTGDVTFTDNANPTTQQVALSGSGKE